MKRIIALIALTLTLSCCGKGAQTTAPNAAGAEVLPGSVSDAMLDPDQSRAEAPLVVARPVANPSRAPQDAAIPEEDAQPADNGAIAPEGPATKAAAAPSSAAVTPKPKPKPAAR